MSEKKSNDEGEDSPLEHKQEHKISKDAKTTLANVSDTIKPPSNPPPEKPDKEKEREMNNASYDSKTSEKIHDLLFAVRRSVRYHNSRVQFLDALNKIFTMFTAASGVGAVMALLRKVDSIWAMVFAAAAAVFSTIDLIVRTGQAARRHSDLARQFIMLEKDIVANESTDDENTLVMLTNRRLDIEENEPPVLRILDVLCHNELLRAMGYPGTDQIKLSWYQRLFAPLFDVHAHAISFR